MRKPEMNYKFRWLFGSGIFLFFVSLGYFISVQYDKSAGFQHLNQDGTFRVELIDSPIEKGNSFLCKIRTLEFIDSSVVSATKGKALLYIQKDSLASRLRIGDQLLVRTKFQQPDGVQNPDGFNYAVYLKRKGIGATAWVSDYKWKFAGHNSGFSLKNTAGESRSYLLSIYKKHNLKDDEFAVLAALTLGYKDALQPDLRENYSASGAMHILAVSGLHVGVIYLVLSFLLSFMNKKQQLKIYKTIIIILLLWIYAFITGLSPSVIRSTLMFSFIAGGTALKRNALIYNTISVSAFIMLLFNPNNLYDVGFQLSYSAVISIIYFQPAISKWLYVKNKLLRWLWDLMAVSLAAQIGTAPFAIFYFHQFANYFLLTNFIAIPAATLIIYLAVTLLVVSPVSFLADSVAFILKWTLKILNYCIESIHNLPYALSRFSIDFWQLVLIFSAIIFISAYFKTKKAYLMLSASASVLIVFLISLSINFATLNSNKIIVYADNKNTHVDFIQGKSHYLFTTDSDAVNKIAGNFWINNRLDNQLNIKDEKFYSNGFVSFKGKKICILTDNSLSNKSTSKPFIIDYLIIGNGIKPKISQILECIQPRKIIVDKSISKWYSNQIKEVCKNRNIRFYSVAERGAYVLDIKD